MLPLNLEEHWLNHHLERRRGCKGASDGDGVGRMIKKATVLR